MTSGLVGDAGMNLANNERRMLKGMLSEPKNKWTLDQLLSVTGWDDQVHVAGAGKGLQAVSYTHLTLPTTPYV